MKTIVVDDKTERQGFCNKTLLLKKGVHNTETEKFSRVTHCTHLPNISSISAGITRKSLDNWLILE